MLANGSLTISSPGLQQQDRMVLQSAISELSHDGKAFQLLNKNINSAQLLVLDDDSEGGKTLLKQSRAGQVKLVLSSTPKAGKNIIPIKKPLDITTLKQLLARIFEKMQAQLARQRPTQKQTSLIGDKNQNTQSNELNQSLFGVLLDAKSNQLILRISVPKHSEIYVDGVNRSIATSASEEILRELINKPREQLWIEQILASDFESQSSQHNITPLYSTLWVAAVECSKGRLLPGHDMNTPVKLRAWPNFTRNDFRAQHLKLAAVLARQATPLDQLEAMTQVPFPDIANFYNAAYAVDLIDTNTDQTTQAQPQKTVSKQMKSLFNRIAQRLSFN